MFTIYNDNILLLNMCIYTLYDNTEYDNNILTTMLLSCDKDPCVLLPCLYYVFFLLFFLLLVSVYLNVQFKCLLINGLNSIETSFLSFMIHQDV